MQTQILGEQVHPPQQHIVSGEYGQQVLLGVPGQQVMMMVEPQKTQHNGLIRASYICSGIGLFVFGIILGPTGFVLALIAKTNGDQRGNGAMIFAVVVTILTVIVLILISPELI
jgi:heme/copper-type cytochrome/quinol oxidase subunit 2